MFGYVITNAEALPKERQKRFRSFYCGLCRTLRAEYGLTGTATLSFDMTFLAILLNALYEPGETRGRERCLTHPVRLHNYVDTLPLRYAADMNVALAYYKCLDNWQDDRNVVSLAESKLLSRAYDRIKSRYPEKCAAIEDWLHKIHAIEADGFMEIDPPVNATGAMLAELFDWHPGDVWSEPLRAIGDGLGRFIYFMDAYDDLPDDIRKHRYNPLKAFNGRDDYETMCRDAMLMMVADATAAFELLPIVQDADILRNILYSGIWSKYAVIQKKRGTEEREQNESGSV